VPAEPLGRKARRSVRCCPPGYRPATRGLDRAAPQWRLGQCALDKTSRWPCLGEGGDRRQLVALARRHELPVLCCSQTARSEEVDPLERGSMTAATLVRGQPVDPAL